MIYLYKNLYKYHTVFLAVGANVKFNDSLPSHLLISSKGQNFVTPTANFCDHLQSLFLKISKKFKNTLSFKYFSLLSLLYAKNDLFGAF
jgi:hypothetical protein